MKLKTALIVGILFFGTIIWLTYEGIKETHEIIHECEAKGGISVHSQGYGYICVRKDTIL